jgi:hypothetical protein
MKKYKPTKAEINHWVKTTLEHFDTTSKENRPAKIRQLKENVEAWENQLAEKTNEDFYAYFPIGECNRELKIKYEAAKIVLNKIETYELA